MNSEFDFDKALEELKSGKPLTGKEGILKPLIMCNSSNLI